MPYMTNLSENGKLGDAVAVYVATDRDDPDFYYIPVRFLKAIPEAIGFLLVKTDKPCTMRPIYRVDDAVALIWPADRENVRAYLTDKKRRVELEPMYLGLWVAETSKAIIAPLPEVA